MILLALGSNIAPCMEYLARARAALEAAGICILRASSIHETPALLPPDAPAHWDMPYLNQVLKVQTRLRAPALLHGLQAIERALGRVDRGRWAPREIDIDLLAYEDQIVQSEVLRLPHPLLHTRDFVLRPLCEIAPDWIHPQLKCRAQLLLEAL